MSSHVFKIATQEPEKLLAAVSESLGANSRIARQVAEQMPKPAIEEPTAWGSVVRARVDEFEEQRVLWQRGFGGGWNSEEGAFVGGYSMLMDVEVLRIGVAPADVDEFMTSAGFAPNADEKLRVLIRDLIQYASSAITAPEKYCYQVAIQRANELLEKP